MPRIVPNEPSVVWPEKEGVLGVVGVAPWATLEFCRLFFGLFKVSKDWEYPRVIVDMNSKIPSRGRFLELGERDPSPFIAETIHELAAEGATVAVVPCNTAHILYESWARNATIPVLNIVEVTSTKAFQAGIVKALVLNSRLMWSNQIYSKSLMMVGVECEEVPPALQESVGRLIEVAKRGNAESIQGEAELLSILTYMQLKKIDCVVLGCTELGLFSHRFQEAGYVVIDSGLALAEAAREAIRTSK